MSSPLPPEPSNTAPGAGSHGAAPGAGGEPSSAGTESRWQRESDAFLHGSAPEIADLPRETRWKAWRYRVLWTALVAVVALAVSVIFSVLPNLSPFVKTREARTEDEARDRVQSEKPPLSANVRYQDVMDVWKQVDSLYIIFDTPFSASESAELEGLRLNESDWDRITELITGHGARPVVDQLFNARYDDLGEMISGDSGYGQPFFLDVTSGRDSSVQIVDMRAKEEKCTRSRAQAVLTIPADGASAIESIAFNLQGLGDARAQVPQDSEERNAGRPYFNQKVVSVGGSSEPVTFNVTPYSRLNSRCEWRILATYNTSDEKGKRSEIDDGGKVLVTEGLPQNPRQQWVMDPHIRKIVECNANPKGSAYCRPLIAETTGPPTQAQARALPPSRDATG